MLSYLKGWIDLSGTYNLKKTLAVDGPFFSRFVRALSQNQTTAGAYRLSGPVP